MRSLRLAFATTALALLPPSLAAADGDATAGKTKAADGDATAGKTKAVACLACHGEGAPASTAAPNLGGQPTAFIAKQLTAFQHGERVHPLMTAISHQLSAADVADLAAYWSAQPKGATPRVTEPAVTAIWQPRMAFPKDFPTGFTAYRTSNNPDKKIINRMFINAAGLRAARAGQPLPNGTVIMMINYAPKLGADGKPTAGADGAWAPDHVAWYAGMEIRAGAGNGLPPLLRNADWTYNQFSPEKTPRPINQAECLACHKGQAAADYLFSYPELHAAH